VELSEGDEADMIEICLGNWIGVEAWDLVHGSFDCLSFWDSAVEPLMYWDSYGADDPDRPIVTSLLPIDYPGILIRAEYIVPSRNACFTLDLDEEYYSAKATGSLTRGCASR
jgi:hypothetical protein